MRLKKGRALGDDAGPGGLPFVIPEKAPAPRVEEA